MPLVVQLSENTCFCLIWSFSIIFWYHINLSSCMLEENPYLHRLCLELLHLPTGCIEKTNKVGWTRSVQYLHQYLFNLGTALGTLLCIYDFIVYCTYKSIMRLWLKTSHHKVFLFSLNVSHFHIQHKFWMTHGKRREQEKTNKGIRSATIILSLCALVFCRKFTRIPGANESLTESSSMLCWYWTRWTNINFSFPFLFLAALAALYQPH